MTRALCIKCGSDKTGSFVPCSACEFQPTTDKELAHSLVLSDHHQPEEMLDEIGAKMQSGELDGVAMSPEQEAEIITHIRKSGIRKMCGIESPKAEENAGAVMSSANANTKKPLWVAIYQGLITWGLALLGFGYAIAQGVGYPIAMLYLVSIVLLARLWLNNALREPQSIVRHLAVSVALAWLLFFGSEFVYSAALIASSDNMETIPLADISGYAVMIMLLGMLGKAMVLGIAVPGLYMLIRWSIRAMK